MPLTRRLAPLLDHSFLLTFARHLVAARHRLSLRTGGNLPSLGELVVALRLYIASSDRARVENGHDTPRALPPPPSRSRPSISRHPAIPELAYYLAVADAAYTFTPHDLETRLREMRIPKPIAASQQASKWQPGFFIASDPRYARIVVTVRGSKELGDLITNLSADMEPFMTGGGHQGIVRSAHNLHQLIRPRLARLIERKKPARGLVVVGHSLGGAVASALTMILRDPLTDREFDENNETAYAKQVFRNTRCFSYAPPPFLTEDLARQSRRMDITTLVAGFDLVPRLSAASLDRFLTAVSRYNWGRDINHSFGRTVENLTSTFLPPERARSVSTALMEHGVGSLSLASSAIAHTARAALETTSRGERRSAMWNLALNGVAFLSSMVGESLSRSQQRALVDSQRQPDYSFARHFDMTEQDVERVLVHEAPRDLFLAGRIYHVERGSEPQENDAGFVPGSQLVQRDAAFFRDIEPTSWMVHDHHPDVIVLALESAYQ